MLPRSHAVRCLPSTNHLQQVACARASPTSLAALAGVVALGTAGFMLIEGWSLGDSLYMTLMTVTTVGYGPPLPLSPAGRNFSIFFMVVGVGTAGYLLSTAVQALVQSEILAAFGERRRQREMSKLKDHFIICGAGRVGPRIVRELQRAGVPFVVVESDPRKAADAATCPTRCCSSATRRSTRRCARPASSARAALAACLPDDADNLYVVLLGARRSTATCTSSRAPSRSRPSRSSSARARAASSRPTIIGSHRMAQALLKPAVADFMDSITAENLDLAFEQVEVAHGSALAGRKLRDTTIRSELDMVVAAIRRAGGEMIFNPSGDTQIVAGDLLIAIGRAESLAGRSGAMARRKFE